VKSASPDYRLPRQWNCGGEGTYQGKRQVLPQGWYKQQREQQTNKGGRVIPDD